MTATAITSLGEVTEVPEKARRRTYTVEYKLKIVKEAEACKPASRCRPRNRASFPSELARCSHCRTRR
jgi:hypothetical protein